MGKIIAQLLIFREEKIGSIYVEYPWKSLDVVI